MVQTRGEMLREKLANFGDFLRSCDVAVDDNAEAMINDWSDGELASWINVNIRPSEREVKSQSLVDQLKGRVGASGVRTMTQDERNIFFLYMECFLSLTKA